MAEVTPSKLVAGVLGGAPCVISTKSGVVIPKNDGRFWIVKLACVPVLATVPETRVKRRYRVSTLAFAGVLPEAAVKAVTCRERVCPGKKMEPSVLPAKEFVGIVSPLLSTRKGLGLTSVALTEAPRGTLGLITLPEVASTRSLVTKVNCVEEEGTTGTIPSIQSPVVVDSGSYSSKVKVPSEFRTVSMLATCPCTTQEENERLKRNAVQFGEKTVEEFAMAVTEPRVAVFTVTD